MLLSECREGIVTERKRMEADSPFNRNVLRGRVALVTGGGSGIGYEVARQLGLHGAHLVLMGRRLLVLQAAAQALETEGVQVEVAQGDVRSSDDAVRAVESALFRFGRLDILVNGAAGNFLSPAEALTPNAFKTVLEIDTMGTFNMCHAAFPVLRKGGRGRTPESEGGGVILNISATLQYGATWYQAHASAAKAAVDSLTRSLCLEWGEYDIRINGVAPGPIADTPGLVKLGSKDGEAIRDDIAQEVPLGRLGTTWDVAMTSLFLVSSAASWISGETVVVDGGHWLSKPQKVSRDAVVHVSRSAERASRRTGIAGKPVSRL